MPVERRLIVGLGIAEQFPGRRLVLRRRPDEAVVVVMPDLVPEVPEQSSVRLGHRLAELLTVDVVALGEIHGDDAVLVSGEDLLELAGQQIERQSVVHVLVASDDR